MANEKAVIKVDAWIEGQFTAPTSNAYFDDLNPLDDSVYARAGLCTPADVERAVRSAHDSFKSYRLTVPKQREAWLCKAAELMEQRAGEIIEVLVDEGGSTLLKARFEIGFAQTVLRAAAGMARNISGKTMPSDVPGRFSMSIRQPLGVVACVTPFNIPLLKGIRLTANAMAIGNTTVLLPSEDAPVIAAHIARLYQDAGFPAGSFNYVTGLGHEIGDSLTTHPLVRAVSFTGSSRVGQHIRNLCASHGKNVILELGGKSPFVVLKDADVQKAAADAVFSIFINQGQVCMGASRIYVERPVFDAFLTQFVANTKKVGMGELRDPSTMIGPSINQRQRDRVRSHIEDAVAQGAKIQTGGNWRGNRCEPTILTGVTPSMTVCREETFGPVTSVYAIDSVEEALALANDSVYGLSAAIYTSNITTALRFAQDVKSGMVHINAPTPQDEPHAPFGGVGQSGVGREGTDGDIEALTEWKWITVQL